ncbi:small glutamine-rich tetratricopeptide repeat-containing protein alpha-like isoform X1 [Centruroides sculpturatus]|uniref:small glutamine-rich tetratricopeptide repeat-containing protein alpha-like isoform X1 n=1 Tax=Centruroides sculpturatus TaxID=218467 RepID=UPI000C6DFF70|nr:small glutamine-rich tetratricopeptide repeat-containing protein alpha-like isoform X1 [Centruroides sculpturatus]
MSDVKRLVASFVQFLGDQLRNADLTLDAKESIEVAIQCLESAFGVSAENEASSSHSLLQIFTEATKDSVDENAKASEHVEVSEASKAEAENLKVLGNNHMKSENFNAAIDCYTKAIHLDPNNSVFYCNRAAAYSKLNNHKAAIQDCEAAIKIDPSYSKAYGRMGLAHASLDQYQQAKECFQHAISLDPQNESYINNLKVAEEKIKSGSSASGNRPDDSRNLGAGFNVPFDFSSILSNPLLMNMATQIMQDPNMQNLLTGLMSGSVRDGRDGMDALLQAGQQLAAQMQASNPELVEQFRRQMESSSRQNPPENNN